MAMFLRFVSKEQGIPSSVQLTIYQIQIFKIYILFPLPAVYAKSTTIVHPIATSVGRPNIGTLPYFLIPRPRMATNLRWFPIVWQRCW